MAHYAKIENGLVTQVLVAEQEFIDTLDGQWLQTSYNTQANKHKLGGNPLRGNYAGIGYIYDSVNDVFYAQKPYESWVLDESTWTWKAPIAMPTDDKLYYWNEEIQSWEYIE